MSQPYILVNPKTSKQFAALVKFLKESECSFKVPENQHFYTSYLCANQDMLEGAIENGLRTGLLSLEDVKIFGEDVEDYTGHKLVGNIQHYKIPKETRDFWGTEYLDKDGYITVESAKQRLTGYAKHQSRLLPYEVGLRTDPYLCGILNTNKDILYFTELPYILSSL